MSIRVMTRVWEHAPYKESTLLVLLALADYADDHGICWPDIPALATKARISERRATDIIKALEHDGAILFERGGGRGRRSRYAILVGLTEDQKERVKLFHRNYFSEIKTLKPTAKKGELQRRKRVNYSVNSHTDLEQQDAPNVDPIRHVDPSIDPPPSSSTQKLSRTPDKAVVMMMYDKGFESAKAINAIARLGVDRETIATSIDNLRADGWKENGRIMRRLQEHPPEPGKPYPRTKALNGSAPLTATRPSVPPDALSPAEVARLARAKRGTT